MVKASIIPLLLATPLGAYAAWETVPEVSIFAETEDNVLLEAGADTQSASRTGLDATITTTNFDERGSFYIQPRIITDAYSDADAKNFESDDVFFDTGGQYSWRVVGVGFRSSYSEELILNSEFVSAIPGDPDLDPSDDFTDPDTGRLVLFTEQREIFNIRGNLDFRISERNQLRFEATRQDVAYTGGQLFDRSNFDNNSLSLAILRRVDERNSVSARMTVSEYYSDSADNTTDSVGVEGTFTRPIAQTWDFTLRAGVQRSEYDFLQSSSVRVANAATAPTFGIGFRKRAERTSWNLDFSHRSQPSGNGFLVVREEIRAYAQHEFTQRLAGRVGLLYSQTETLDDVRTSDNRDYARADVGLEWALKQTLFVSVGLQRSSQKFVNESSVESTSNALVAGITYRGRSRQNQ